MMTCIVGGRRGGATLAWLAGMRYNKDALSWLQQKIILKAVAMSVIRNFFSLNFVIRKYFSVIRFECMILEIF